VKRTRRSGLSLVEVVVAGAILVVVVLAIGAMLAQSARGTKEAGPRLLAQHAALRVAERLRSMPYATGYAAFWNVAVVSTISGTQWAAPRVNTPADYTGTPWNECILPLIQAMTSPNRRLVGPLDDPLRPLRVRFCTEQEYQQMWGVAAGPPSDLDFNGLTDTLGVNRANYSIRPVLIQVRWRTEGRRSSTTGTEDDFYQLRTIQMAEPLLDPDRGT
jgi:hypothetical protein